ncbi:MAG: cupredoxin domain-containing protein [Planctomycetota bacterium]
MNKVKAALVILLLLGVTVVPAVGIFAYEAYRTRNLTADIVARAPERGNYTPRELTVRAGQPVRLRVRNLDTVTHGFAIPELGVDAGEIKAGHVKWLEFTPERPGSYSFYCTVWCSDYHLQMNGVLNVAGPGERVADRSKEDGKI